MPRALVLATALAACSAPQRAASTRRTHARVSRAFVERRGRCLVREGRRLRWVGSSAFYLQEEAARELLGQPLSRGTTTAAFDAAGRAGVGVLRVLGFNDGRDDAAVIQRSLGALSEAGLRGLDRVVMEAARRNILLIVLVTNYWSAYGGATQYLRWLGVAPEARAEIFRDVRVADAIARYATRLAERTNAFTGIRYADDPTIMGWEVMNEPRGDGLDDRGEAIARFVDAIARALHAVAPRQLVFSGDEGMDANERGYDAAYWRDVTTGERLLGETRHESFRAIAATPSVDVTTVHWYPDAWRVSARHEREAGARWIEQHARIADEYGKPIILEEFGELEHAAGRDAPRTVSERSGDASAWFDALRSAPNGAGFMPWGLALGRASATPDGFEWGGRDDDPFSLMYRSMSARIAADTATLGCDSATR
jgi:mannan endo-1,4-beta-mannosidase